MAVYLSEGMAQARFSFLLMAALGGIALLLAAVGIFGVIAYTVTQRTREFGIRLALGEDPAQTRRSVSSFRGMGSSARASASAWPARCCSTRLLGGLLYQVSPYDPLTLGGIAARAHAGRPCRLLPAGPARDRGGSRDHAPERMMDKETP